MSKFNHNFHLEPNVILFINDEKYLSEYCENPIEKGIIPGGYFGSGSRIPKGEIWKPDTGYINIKITLKIFQDNNWITIFDEMIDSHEQLINTIILEFEDEKNRYLKRNFSEEELREFAKLGVFNGTDEIDELEKINNLDNLDELEKIKQIENINESLNFKTLMDFDRSKNNQIQKITGGIESPYFISRMRILNEKYRINLNLRNLYRFNGEIQIGGCLYELL